MFPQPDFSGRGFLLGRNLGVFSGMGTPRRGTLGGEGDRIGERTGGRFFLAHFSACLIEVLLVGKLVLFTVEVALNNSGLIGDRFSKLMLLASTEIIHNKQIVSYQYPIPIIKVILKCGKRY